MFIARRVCLYKLLELSSVENEVSDRANRIEAIDEAKIPKYRRVAFDLISQISSGVYPIGSLLPREVELSAQYGITRHTMREALRHLDAAGLISRRRRAGTKVVATEPVRNYRQPVNSIANVLRYGEDTALSALQIRRVRWPASLGTLLECKIGIEWLLVETRRSRLGDAQPICLTRNYVTLELPGVEKLIKEQFGGPVSALLEHIYGLRIERIEQSVEAIRLRPRQAKLLNADQGSPALRAVRRYYDSKERLIECSDAIHPGGRFSYTTRLVRGSG